MTTRSALMALLYLKTLPRAELDALLAEPLDTGRNLTPLSGDSAMRNHVLATAVAAALLAAQPAYADSNRGIHGNFQ
jgi:hypothetical protein